MRHSNFIITPLFFLLTVASVFGQIDTLNTEPKTLQYDDRSLSPISFEDKQIENFKNDDAFDYTEKQSGDNWWQRFKRWLNNIYNDIISWLFGDYEANTFIAFLVKILPYILIGLLIGFMVWLFIRLNPGDKLLQNKDHSEVFLSEDEEIIQKRDIPKLIQEALQNNDYRLAIRYYYLLMLKQLGDKDIIDYEFQKTNADYSSEIKEQAISSNFKQLTRIYDFTWYGDFKVTQTDFNSAERQFKALETQL